RRLGRAGGPLRGQRAGAAGGGGDGRGGLRRGHRRPSGRGGGGGRGAPGAAGGGGGGGVGGGGGGGGGAWGGGGGRPARRAGGAERGPAVTGGEALEAVEALGRRSLLERSEGGAGFTLQPVVLEHATDELVAAAVAEIRGGRPALLVRHPLVKATAKDYVRR